MSKSDTSEEKTLPASAKKLKDLRKKGRISRSNDMVSGAATTVACFYLMITANSFSHDFRTTVNVIFNLQNAPFDLASSEALNTLGVFLGLYLATLIVIVVCVVIVANIVINRGFLFSLDPIKLDFNKMNPVEGFQRIFSVRTAVELAKNIIKIGLLCGFCLAALASGLKAAFSIPFCGFNCVGPVANQIAFPMIMIAVSIFILAGMIDILLQTWLFKRDQRMTKTEAKRERKDEEGSPEVRTTQRRLRRRLLQQASKYTEADATIVIEGLSTAIGLRFVRNETPLPIIVCKGRGEQASDILNIAQGQKTPIHFDDEFATKLAQRADIGSSLTETFFEAFIKALKATGQI
jgi:type III secretion protein U